MPRFSGFWKKHYGDIKNCCMTAPLNSIVPIYEPIDIPEDLQQKKLQELIDIDWMEGKQLKWIGWDYDAWFCWTDSKGMLYRIKDLKRNELGKRFEKEVTEITNYFDGPPYAEIVSHYTETKKRFYEFELAMQKECRFCADPSDVSGGGEEENKTGSSIGGVKEEEKKKEEEEKEPVDTTLSKATDDTETTYTEHVTENYGVYGKTEDYVPNENEYGWAGGSGSGGGSEENPRKKDEIDRLPILPVRMMPVTNTKAVTNTRPVIGKSAQYNASEYAAGNGAAVDVPNGSNDPFPFDDYGGSNPAADIEASNHYGVNNSSGSAYGKLPGKDNSITPSTPPRKSVIDTKVANNIVSSALSIATNRVLNKMTSKDVWKPKPVAANYYHSPPKKTSDLPASVGTYRVTGTSSDISNSKTSESLPSSQPKDPTSEILERLNISSDNSEEDEESEEITEDSLPEKEVFERPNMVIAGLTVALSFQNQLAATAFSYARQSLPNVARVLKFDYDDHNVVVVTYWKSESIGNDGKPLPYFYRTFSVFREDGIDRPYFKNAERNPFRDISESDFFARSEDDLFSKLAPIVPEFWGPLTPEATAIKAVALAVARPSKKVILAHAARYGIKEYKELVKATKNTGLEVHHIIEKRFAHLFGINKRLMKSVVLTKKEHEILTLKWRKKIGYSNDKSSLKTQNVFPSDVLKIAKIIYKDYPEIIKILNLLP